MISGHADVSELRILEVLIPRCASTCIDTFMVRRQGGVRGKERISTKASHENETNGLHTSLDCERRSSITLCKHSRQVYVRHASSHYVDPKHMRARSSQMGGGLTSPGMIGRSSASVCSVRTASSDTTAPSCGTHTASSCSSAAEPEAWMTTTTTTLPPPPVLAKDEAACSAPSPSALLPPPRPDRGRA